MLVMEHTQAGLMDANRDPALEEDIENLNIQEEVFEDLDFVVNNHGGMETIRMITECLSRYDIPPPHTEAEDRSEPIHKEEDEEFTSTEEDYATKVMEELLEHARNPLFEDAGTNRLVATLMLLNSFTVFGVSNSFAHELLHLLQEILPKANHLPGSYYLARKYVAKLGL